MGDWVEEAGDVATGWLLRGDDAVIVRGGRDSGVAY